MNDAEGWTIEVVAGPDCERSFQCPKGCSLMVGRGSDSDTRIADPKISRIHCELRSEAEGLIIIDRGGSGGTLIDGEPLDGSCRLLSGVELELGQSRLRIRSNASLDQKTIQSKTGPHVASVLEEPRSRLGPPPDSILGGGVGLQNLVGEKLHRFRIDACVVHGRNSDIYRAFDTRRERVVALKVMHPRIMSTDEQRERFVRAMRTTLPIRHPNIVRLYKAGRKGSLCWAAMEWIDGISVKELIEQLGVGGMLDWKETWRIAVQIGLALRQVEQHQIVHRNVTPSNLMRRQNSRDYVLMDLVLSRAQDLISAPQLTRPGDVLGEIAYIAPERFLNGAVQDPRSDQYGLGATLYTLLCGRPPYDALDVGGIIEQTRSHSPQHPIEFQLGLDERFGDVVMKMISKSPENRFSSSEELIERLAEVGKMAGIRVEWDEWVG
ncbi:MAG: FHA domain-containing serine/threonine-protein kinase [Planctomycetota bacterium]